MKEGRFTARVIELGASTEVVKLVLNPVREASIPTDVRRAVDSVATGIKIGAISLTREYTAK